MAEYRHRDTCASYSAWKAAEKRDVEKAKLQYEYSRSIPAREHSWCDYFVESSQLFNEFDETFSDYKSRGVKLETEAAMKGILCGVTFKWRSDVKVCMLDGH